MYKPAAVADVLLQLMEADSEEVGWIVSYNSSINAPRVKATERDTAVSSDSNSVRIYSGEPRTSV